MITTPWLNNTHTHTHGIYTFKRKIRKDSERYEIWKSGELMMNDLTYWQFMSKYDRILSGRINDGMWWVRG